MGDSLKEFFLEKLDGEEVNHVREWFSIAMFMIGRRPVHLLEVESTKQWVDGERVLEEIRQFFFSHSIPFVNDEFGRELYYHGPEPDVSNLAIALDYPEFENFSSMKINRIGVSYNIHFGGGGVLRGVMAYVRRYEELTEEESRRRERYIGYIEEVISVLDLGAEVEVIDKELLAGATVVDKMIDGTLDDIVFVCMNTVYNMGFGEAFVEHAKTLSEEEIYADISFWVLCHAAQFNNIRINHALLESLGFEIMDGPNRLEDREEVRLALSELNMPRVLEEMENMDDDTYDFHRLLWFFLVSIFDVEIVDFSKADRFVARALF